MLHTYMYHLGKRYGCGSSLLLGAFDLCFTRTHVRMYLAGIPESLETCPTRTGESSVQCKSAATTSKCAKHPLTHKVKFSFTNLIVAHKLTGASTRCSSVLLLPQEDYSI